MMLGPLEATRTDARCPYPTPFRTRLGELLEHAGLDLARGEAAGRHHDVVAGAARQQLGLEDLVGIEDVVDDADAGFLLEVFQDRLIDVVGPVVDVDDLFLRRGRAERQDESDRTCRNRSEEHTSELQALMRISYAAFCLKKKN